MALKAVHVSDVPNLDQVPEGPSVALYSAGFARGEARAPFKAPKFLVIGHRGHGMNVLQSSDGRMRGFKENTLLSFNAAAKHPVDYVEFDVQVRAPGSAVFSEFLTLLRVLFCLDDPSLDGFFRGSGSEFPVSCYVKKKEKYFFFFSLFGVRGFCRWRFDRFPDLDWEFSFLFLAPIFQLFMSV